MGADIDVEANNRDMKYFAADCKIDDNSENSPVRCKIDDTSENSDVRILYRVKFQSGAVLCVEFYDEVDIYVKGSKDTTSYRPVERLAMLCAIQFVLRLELAKERNLRHATITVQKKEQDDPLHVSLMNLGFEKARFFDELFAFITPHLRESLDESLSPIVCIINSNEKEEMERNLHQMVVVVRKAKDLPQEFIDWMKPLMCAVFIQ